MRYHHADTGMTFFRMKGCRPIKITGGTYNHRDVLRAAGFVWDGESWRGGIEHLESMPFLLGMTVARGLGVPAKSWGGKLRVIGS